MCNKRFEGWRDGCTGLEILQRKIGRVVLTCLDSFSFEGSEGRSVRGGQVSPHTSSQPQIHEVWYPKRTNQKELRESVLGGYRLLGPVKGGEGSEKGRIEATMYPWVPLVLRQSSCGERNLDTPKSVSLMYPSSLRRIFSGLMSPAVNSQEWKSRAIERLTVNDSQHVAILQSQDHLTNIKLRHLFREDSPQER